MAIRLRMAISAAACVAFGLALPGCMAENSPDPYQPPVVDAYRSFAANASGTWLLDKTQPIVLDPPSSAAVASPQISLRVTESTEAEPFLGVVTVTDSLDQSERLVAYSANLDTGSLGFDPPRLIVFCATEADPQGNFGNAKQVQFLYGQAERGHWVLVRIDPPSRNGISYQRKLSQ